MGFRVREHKISARLLAYCAHDVTARRRAVARSERDIEIPGAKPLPTSPVAGLQVQSLDLQIILLQHACRVQTVSAGTTSGHPKGENSGMVPNICEVAIQEFEISHHGAHHTEAVVKAVTTTTRAHGRALWHSGHGPHRAYLSRVCRSSEPAAASACQSRCQLKQFGPC